ncbi:protein-tyrosine-phosphatase [Salegentibacter sp. F188]|uniref:Protein-tyrosine-phosphatase n=1 Tax=Autumnicola patrickiae TaxID=3075591 RepID=A0ABU3E0C3_9FLAO|nr:protein-tyrosine-phosphatase [Salegentibacter sp. F188]MDT0689338.1 protein-tyrosine-phosphatase [Salegentibacter sp. F188]
MKKTRLLPSVQQKIASFDINGVSEERKEVLKPLIQYIKGKIIENEQIKLHFICTHNSRRSQFSQIWAQAMAAYCELEILAFSGGVEVTAFNENAVSAIKNAGFEVSSEGTENPVYAVNYAQDAPALKMYSKKFDDTANPEKNFAAIMTCSHADETCPFIPGAEKRIPVKYDDPKAFDGTPQQDQKYEERSNEIATEMLYVFSTVQQQKFV